MAAVGLGAYYVIDVYDLYGRSADVIVTQMASYILRRLLNTMHFMAASSKWNGEHAVMKEFVATMQKWKMRMNGKDAGCEGEYIRAARAGVSGEHQAMMSVVQRYAALVEVSMERKPVSRWIFPADLLNKVDVIFETTLKNELGNFGNNASVEWQTAMERYWDAVTETMETYWKEGQQSLGQRNARAADALALQYAPAKLRWVRQLVRLGCEFNLPLPTASMVKSLIPFVHQLGTGFYWVSPSSKIS